MKNWLEYSEGYIPVSAINRIKITEIDDMYHIFAHLKDGEQIWLDNDPSFQRIWIKLDEIIKELEGVE